MNFKTSKTLCIIGALLLALRAIPGIHIISHTDFHDFHIIRIASLICGIIGLYGISKFYQSKNIITNAQISIAIVIIGTILNFAFGGIISSLIKNVIEETYAGAYAMLSRNAIDGTFITVAAFFARRSLKELATRSGVALFTTAAHLLLIGAILSIIIIGTPIVWITFLIITVATFKMKEPKLNTSLTTEKPTTTQPHQTISETNTETKYCTKCGTPVTPNTIFCTHCGKQI